MSLVDGKEVDLTNCDREPIHQLGLIQPFGALVAVTMDWIVAHRSANCPEILGTRKPIEAGERLADHFTPAALDLLREWLDIADRDGTVERLFGVDLTGTGALFDVALHRSGRVSIIEAEPHDQASFPQHTGSLRPIMERLGGKPTIAELSDEAARYLKRLLGFDRVMVYRFHEDLSGEVIAEAREPQLEAFLHLRYPKSDIPDQARRLYVKNLFRIISDVNADPVPIEPAAGVGGEPLDLSLSTLRAVSPIHIEYLKNMGVGASLSISIVVKGKLWGLFACHHYSARVLPYSLRTVAELFSQLFSLQLDLAIASAGALIAERGREIHDRLMSRLVGGTSLADNLVTIAKVVEEVIPHDGSSAFIDGDYEVRGMAPTEAEFLAVVPALNTGSTGQILHSDSLAAQIPAAAAFADRAVGALVIPVSRRPRDYVVLWRRELPQVVTWAGNPDKPVDYGPHGARLTPRKSFEAWQESVRGRGAPWTPEERSIAESVRVTLLEVILRMTEDQMRERDRAQEQQELLIAELNHRVRNILTLIRGLVSQSRGEKTNVEDFAELIGGRIRALAMAHDNITREHWEPASLHRLIQTEAEAYLAGKTERILINGTDALIAPEAYTVIALVLHEMMTNSAKYGSLCDSSGQLEIDTRIDKAGDLLISWKESGGPPVRPPQRRGFGTTIIEKSIPYELRGEAEVRHRLPGLEADFRIPKRFVHGTGPGAGSDIETTREIKPAGDGDKLGSGVGHVLLVEDSMIIALDAEDALRQLGVTEISVANSVRVALGVIERDPPRLALLDYNLGDESSERIARQLKQLGIPFWFVTGYGEAISALTNSAAEGVLQKPYSREDLAHILQDFAALAATTD